jgi:hypothetical protein
VAQALAVGLAQAQAGNVDDEGGMWGHGDFQGKQVATYLIAV